MSAPKRMKLSDYIKQLQDVEKKHGGNLECIYSGDDEGNYYNFVFYSPTPGTFKNGDFESTVETKKKPNVVCVN